MKQFTREKVSFDWSPHMRSLAPPRTGSWLKDFAQGHIGG